MAKPRVWNNRNCYKSQVSCHDWKMGNFINALLLNNIPDRKVKTFRKELLQNHKEYLSCNWLLFQNYWGKNKGMLHLFCKVACWVATLGCEGYQNYKVVFSINQNQIKHKIYLCLITPALSGKHLSTYGSSQFSRKGAKCIEFEFHATYCVCWR